MTQVLKRYCIFLKGGLLKQHLLLIIPTSCHRVSADVPVFQCLFMRWIIILSLDLKPFWMKNKPVKWGYKFRIICCGETGFFWKLLPAARVVIPNEEGKKFVNSKLIIIESLPNMNKNKYVVGMDSVFTFHQILLVAKELGVMIFGTERETIGYLPK